MVFIFLAYFTLYNGLQFQGPNTKLPSWKRRKTDLKSPGLSESLGVIWGTSHIPCCHTCVFYLVHSCRMARLWTRPSNLKYFLGVTVFVWTQGFERFLTFFIIWRVQGVLNPTDNNKGPPFIQFVYRLITVWCCRGLQL